MCCVFILFRIIEGFNLKHIKLILNGKTLSPGVHFAWISYLASLCNFKCWITFFSYCLLPLDKQLHEQNVKNNSKIMVLKLSEPEGKRMMMEAEDKKRQHEETMKRTEKGFQILSERGDFNIWSINKHGVFITTI